MLYVRLIDVHKANIPTQAPMSNSNPTVNLKSDTTAHRVHTDDHKKTHAHTRTCASELLETKPN